jgi:Uma2 family endonuclease
MRALPEPAVQVSRTTEFAPDLVVIRQEQATAAKCTEPPLLVVEVRSPNTALIDLNRKKAAYERFGVPTYWVVIPDQGKPGLIAFELRDGRYDEAARISGDEVFAAHQPFGVGVVPARLVAGLQPASA